MTKETWAIPESNQVAKLYHSSRIPGFKIPLQACTELLLMSFTCFTVCYTFNLRIEVQAHFHKQF